VGREVSSICYKLINSRLVVAKNRLFRFLCGKRETKVLQQLDLANNKIGDIGCQYLAEALKVNTVLQQLELGENQIGDIGCQYLIDALKINTSLQELDLRFNQIGNTECQYLADTLKINTSLQKLNLYHNQIGATGCQYLADALRVNTTLQKLHLWYSYNEINNLLKRNQYNKQLLLQRPTRKKEIDIYLACLENKIKFLYTPLKYILYDFYIY